MPGLERHASLIERDMEHQAPGRAARAMAGEPEGQGAPRRADEETLDAIRAEDDLPDARLINEVHICRGP